MLRFALSGSGQIQLLFSAYLAKTTVKHAQPQKLTVLLAERASSSITDSVLTPARSIGMVIPLRMNVSSVLRPVSLVMETHSMTVTLVRLISTSTPLIKHAP